MPLCVLQEGDNEDMDETEDKPLSSHPDADTTIIFVTGEGQFGSLLLCSFCRTLDWNPNCAHMTTLEFPSNEIVKFLVGITNKGSQDFTVKSLEASFRYPQDFQLYIQNVSISV